MTATARWIMAPALALLALVTAPGSSAADGPRAEATVLPADAAARTALIKDAVGKIERRYRALPSFKVPFTQRYTSATFGSHEEARGTIYVVPPSRLLWIYDVPEGQKGALDGTRYWMIDPEDQEVHVRERVPGSSDPVTDLLAGRLDLDRLFEVRLAEEQGHAGRLDLVLVPRSPREDMDRALLQVDVADGTVRRLEVVDPVGGHFAYQLGSPSPAPAPSDAAFRLVVPPGYTRTQD